MSSLKVKITTHKTALTGSLLLIALILAVVGYRRTQAVANARDRSQPLNASIEIYPNQAEQVVNKAVPFVSAVVYGSPSLDVNQIDPASIKLSGASVMRRGNGKLRMKISDLNGDGISDMRFAVWSDKMELSEGAHVASLGAKTFDGREITGQHKVDVVNRPLHTESILNSQQGKTPSRGKVPPVSPLAGSTFTNATAIAINDANPNAAATPYPSQITVAGLPFPGVVAPAYKFTVKIFNFRHHFPEDVDMMLVGPGVGSPRLIFWSDVGGTTSNCGNVGGNCDAVTPGPFLLINDASPALLPVGAALPAAATCTAATVETATACHFKPTDAGTGDNFSAAGTPPPPCSGVAGCDAAAAAPAGANTLNGTFGAITLNPNGVWSLYIMDDTFGDGLGQVANGWALTIVPQPAAFPTSAPANISGTINTPDGQPLAGVALDLKGSSSARTITDSNGHYSFDSLPSGDFYTVTPTRANYSFSPAERSFTLNADKTDAGFAAEETQSVANPLDTDLFFVRQQYLDFLSREPDMGGLGYWTE
ncbi:MAG: carboxypeptidase-like regulatory domain-containing protein, partial [Pyrinomonadaceae bacterium]